MGQILIMPHIYNSVLEDRKRDRLSTYTIYLKDGVFCLLKHVISGGEPKIDNDFGIVQAPINDMRLCLQRCGLTKLMPSVDDNPEIIESWL